MRRTLYSRVAFIMFKNLLSQWRDFSLVKAVGVDNKDSMYHVSKKKTLIFLFFDHYHKSPMHRYQLLKRVEPRL